MRIQRDKFLRGTLAEPPPQNNEDHEPHDPLVETVSKLLISLTWRQKPQCHIYVSRVGGRSNTAQSGRAAEYWQRERAVRSTS